MKKGKPTIKEISLIAMCSAIITVCAWLSFPVFTIPITLQTFGIFLTLLLLGGKNGTFSILIYILLGLVGVPVFSGFKAGPSALFGPTGGYIIGFILIGIVYLLFTRFVSESIIIKTVSLIIGLILCYGFGTVWFSFVYSSANEKIGLLSAMSLCVFPFIIPDLLKLIFAVGLYRILEPILSKIKDGNA